MQNNSLVKIFGFLFLIVSIYQLSFTLISSSLENEAEDYANSRISEDIEDFISKRDNLESKYLDSIGNISIYGFTSYNDAKKRELNFCYQTISNLLFSSTWMVLTFLLLIDQHYTWHFP